jgi:hypothetical protein
VNLDLELFYADNAFTRISPRNLRRYKFRTAYKPLPWVSFTGLANILEKRHNVPLIGNLQHSRHYSFNVSMVRSERLGLDFGYDYTDVFSSSDICFAVGAVIPTGSSACPIVSGTGPTEGISLYVDKTHFGYVNVRFKPLNRVTLNLGYAISVVNGNAPILDPVSGLPVILNPLSPTGSLQYDYHKPYAGMVIDLRKNLAWKASWSYFNYDETGAPDPTGPRSFRANLLDVTLRYQF